MFQTVLDLRDPKFRTFKKNEEPRTHRHRESVSSYLETFPIAFCELVLALDASEKRRERAKRKPRSEFSPEWVVEESFPALRDIESNPKIMAALPRNFPSAKEAAVRKQLSNTNRIREFWELAFARENMGERVNFRLDDDGNVEIWERP
jgi:hypothetical protein